jgi:hypothetical protein
VFVNSHPSFHPAGPASGPRGPGRAGRRRASQLGLHGRPHAAAQRIVTVLSGLDPVRLLPRRAVVRLVVRYLTLDAVTTTDGPSPASEDDAFRLSWSLYAYRGAELLAGTDSLLWEVASARHGEELTRQGLTVDAVTVHRRRLAVAQGRRDPEAIGYARRAVAVALHADGQCADAHEQTRTVLDAWRNDPGGSDVLGFNLLRVRLLLLAGCGLLGQARAALAAHGDVFGAAGTDRRRDAIWIMAGFLPETLRRHQPVCQFHPRAPLDPAGAVAEADRWLALLATPARQPPHTRRPSARLPWPGRDGDGMS